MGGRAVVWGPLLYAVLPEVLNMNFFTAILL